jgi:hypothetical protein
LISLFTKKAQTAVERYCPGVLKELMNITKVINTVLERTLCTEINALKDITKASSMSNSSRIHKKREGKR